MLAVKHNQLVGKWGEDLALDFLMRRKYVLVERNVKTSYWELDLVMKQNDCLVFIEVKTRTSTVYGSASEMINFTKNKSLKQGVQEYMRRQKKLISHFRLDVIAIDVNKTKQQAKIQHFKDVW
ncbi:MAG: YraN family protein [Candidatus Falkowbacteria bacterium]